jgi:hypothetical protein
MAEPGTLLMAIRTGYEERDCLGVTYHCLETLYFYSVRSESRSFRPSSGRVSTCSAPTSSDNNNSQVYFSLYHHKRQRTIRCHPFRPLPCRKSPPKLKHHVVYAGKAPASVKPETHQDGSVGQGRHTNVGKGGKLCTSVRQLCPMKCGFWFSKQWNQGTCRPSCE